MTVLRILWTNLASPWRYLTVRLQHRAQCALEGPGLRQKSTVQQLIMNMGDRGLGHRVSHPLTLA